MGYRRLLAPGEEVVLDVRPHWWYLAGPVTALAAAIAGAIAARVEGAPTWVGWVTVVCLVAAALWLLGRYVRWSSSHFLLTTSRIVERRGVLVRRGREIPVSALADIGFRQSILERVIGIGDVVVESAGRDGQEVFADLPHPEAIHNEIYVQLERRRGWGGGPGWPGAAGMAMPGQLRVSIPEQIDQLDQLRRRGVITEAEFAAKKAELLNRL